ncbi:hypothetical protein BDN72DRAFT_781459 [Pluteus cervinus]|uniref:Uncharacterized protein n=1 Tax=Pluteus cervinus TaxID=181527 RepID=A0ACD2ZZZ9_9AGAR|nr:hypothetical protein BDN72DRAFT_781459 [Pluteus cervinus]
MNDSDQNLCVISRTLFLTLPWIGSVVGFSQTESFVELTTFLSTKSLHTTHIDRQLDILSHDLNASSSDSGLSCHLVGPDFFQKIRSLYQHQTTHPYNSEVGPRYIWRIGSNLSTGRYMKLGGVAHVNGNHWVPIIVDTATSVLLYGDSLRHRGSPQDSELLDALNWWLVQHVSRIFSQQDLAITNQDDSYNCGILSVNGLQHYLMPEKYSLLPSERSIHDFERIKVFNHVVAQMLDTVSYPPSFRITTHELIYCP